MEPKRRKPSAYVASPIDPWLMACQKCSTLCAETSIIVCVVLYVNIQISSELGPSFLNQHKRPAKDNHERENTQRASVEPHQKGFLTSTV